MPSAYTSCPRWMIACLAMLIFASPAFAYDFVLVGNGSDQHLNWYWESSYPVHSCVSDPTPCGNLSSVNGAVSGSYRSFFNPGGFSGVAFVETNSGGSLSWTGNDSLKVVAWTKVSTEAFGGFPPQPFPPCSAESWTAIDARDNPMVFQLLADPGDPPTTNLKLTPQLIGTFNHTTTVGGSTHAQVQMEMTVAVNGVTKTTDTLYSEWDFVEDADGSHVVSFPKGQLNTVMVPNVSISSQVSITIWAYARLYSSITGANGTRGKIVATSPYGAGPAIVVVAQPLGVTAVGDQELPQGLWLRAQPNPSVGPTTIRYALPRADKVRVSIYDVAGQRVATLIDRAELAGNRQVHWNRRKSDGSPLPAGIYLVELVVGEKRLVRPLAVLGR